MADKFGKIAAAHEEDSLVRILEKFQSHAFPVLKKVAARDNINVEGLNVYDLKWYENRLHALEGLEEGEITFNERVKITRKYVAPKTSTPDMYDFYTRIEPTSSEQKRGVMLFVHGINQCSDVWMETQV